MGAVHTMAISQDPMVAISNIAVIDIGRPILTKSFTDKYGLLKSSTIRSELTFGNEENGNAMAADMANALPIVTTSGNPACTPILDITGNNMIDATVCETNVAITPQKNKI